MNTDTVNRLKDFAAGMNGAPVNNFEVPKADFKSAGDLIDENPELREWLINGLLRRRETMNLVAASKKGKTYFLIYIALCVATGRAIFGTFPTRRGAVLMIDNELHSETLARRIHDVAQAMGILREEYSDSLFVQCLRGKVCDLFRMRPYFDSIQPEQFALITIDAWYRMIPPKESENDNAVVTQMLNAIDMHADRTGAAFIVVHHASKGNQSDKAVTDMGSGAGAQSRAVDTHMVLRQHDVEDVVVLDAAVRSFKPVEPICIRWTFPLWSLAGEFDPTNLKQAGNRRRKQATEPTEQKPVDDPWTVEKFVQMFLTDEGRNKKRIVASADLAGLSQRKIETFIQSGLDRGVIHRWTYPRDRVVYLSNREQSVTEITNL